MSSPVPDPPRTSPRIIVAEDDALSRTIIRALLERLGYTCPIVSDGMELIERMLEETFDLVIVDLEMPRLGGLAAARAIRTGIAGADNSRAILVAVTALQREDVEAQCLASGINYFLPKPATRRQLDHVLSACGWASAGRTERSVSETTEVDLAAARARRAAS